MKKQNKRQIAKSNPPSPKTVHTEKETVKRVSFTQHPFFSILLLLLAVTLVYANSLSNGFVFDDIGTIVENKYITELGQNLPSFLPLRTLKFPVLKEATGR